MPQSIWPRLEPLLHKVEKPARYIGGEGNLIAREHGSAEQAKFLLAFPDTYEIGLPNLGLQILYEMLNERAETLAERTYSPWSDLEELMRKYRIPLFSLENHLPADAFDVIGFSCASELVFTNVLNMIDLAGLPVRELDRTALAEGGTRVPLVIAGGHAVSNPEPLASFIDAFVIGDGEEVIFEVAAAVSSHSTSLESGTAPGAARRDLMHELLRIPGVYVPSAYTIDYRSDGTISRFGPVIEGAQEVVEKRVIPSLADFPYPRRPLVPLTEVVHDRLNIEVFRGCQRGCRFCQAGMITRPTRERPKSQVREMVTTGLALTGQNEVSLLSLSTADYSGIESLAAAVATEHADERVSVSLPSLRVDAFTVGLASEIQKVKKTGLTFAPEAGTWRMRRVINKLIADDDLFGAVESAFSQGWRRMKLYFMVGLPTEREEDVIGIAELGRNVIEIGRKFSKGASATLSVGGFVPKSHTPFQWTQMDDAETLRSKIDLLKTSLKVRALKLRWHDPEASVIEGLLSRGDRRVGDVIERVWQKGGVFQEWSEHFDYGLWLTALDDAGLSLDFYCFRERSRDEILPWDHISVGIYRDWLWSDWEAATAQEVVEDCRWTPCYDCGVCMEFGVENLVVSTTAPAGGSQGTGRSLPPPSTEDSAQGIGHGDQAPDSLETPQ